ncbi:hypothetical protein [Rivihabitans pingtungensis]|uniref:hypothetical protein n=1 Tax=Rivihabitans pingtungensis TaxID=1054498 RepID=UPI002B605574|nr:hypothetical protein [Rivihabitans pingtungensis]HNX70092.1 hypothetical protein [Rivihabitans pingtungensis]
MLAHFARLCTVFVRCLACLVGGFLLADLAFVVPRLAPVLCRMFSVFLVCHGFLACVSDAGLACTVCMLSALAGYGFACVMTTMSHGFALAALVCPLAKMLAGMALAMAGDTGMRFAGLLGTCLAADRCGIAWQWQIIGQREAGQQCQHAGKQNAKHEYNPFLKHMAILHCIITMCHKLEKNVLNSPLCGVKFPEYPLKQHSALGYYGKSNTLV